MGSRLHDAVDELNANVSGPTGDLETIKQLLREGFRLPKEAD